MRGLKKRSWIAKRGKQMKKLYAIDDIYGNAFAFVSYTKKAMEESGFTTQEIDEMIEQAKSSDYHHLLIVCQSYIKKCNDLCK